MLQSERDILINTIVGISGVKRFHGHSTIKSQSVADHSARVGQIGFLVALEYFGGDIIKANETCVLGLFHDQSEAILKSDVNSSVKSKYGIREALKKLETQVVEDLFQDSVIRDLILEKANVTSYNLMKMSDTLDFGLFVWDEIKMGNSHMLPLIEAFKTEILRYPKDMLELEFTKSCIKKILS